MNVKSLQLPVELLQLIGRLNEGDLANETAKMLALELFREDKISLGRAAELCHTPIEAFMEFAAEHEVPLHYGIEELEEDPAHSGQASLVTVVSDFSPLITLARIRCFDLLPKLYGRIHVPTEVTRKLS